MKMALVRRELDVALKSLKGHALKAWRVADGDMLCIETEDAHGSWRWEVTLEPMPDQVDRWAWCFLGCTLTRGALVVPYTTRLSWSELGPLLKDLAATVVTRILPAAEKAAAQAAQPSLFGEVR